MKKGLVVAVMLVALLTGAAPAMAVALSGGFSVAGPFEWVNNTSCTTPATCPSVALGAANALDFRILGTNTPSPGVAGTATVFDNSGSFVALAPISSIVNIKDFTYTGAGNANFPAIPPTLLAFETTSGLATVDLVSFTVETHCSAGCTVTESVPKILVTGTAIFHAPGFDNTVGVFQLQGGNVFGNFSFAAQNGVAVPEPSTMILLGLGLSGLGLAGRLRKR